LHNIEGFSRTRQRLSSAGLNTRPGEKEILAREKVMEARNNSPRLRKTIFFFIDIDIYLIIINYMISIIA